MKTITTFLAFLLCGFMLYPQTDSDKPSKNVVLKELQSKNASQPADSIRQAANQQDRMGGIDPDQRIQTQFVPLNQGWSGISSYLNPDDPAVAQMMAAIEQQLIILMDFQGNIYQPSIQNTIITWNFRQGYYIKMASSETLEIIGLEPLSKQIDLQTGWNLIPVLSEVEVDIEDYFFDHNDKIEIVTEVAGTKVFWPDKEIAALTQLTPGKAYLVKVKEPFSLFELPSITTTPISEITAISAISGGSVEGIGSSPVTARGIVWNTDGNPTIDFNQGITLDGQGAGEFLSTLAGLTPATFYYVRAYATNHVGTAYGVELVFVTLQDLFTCGGTFTDSRDSVQYQTVQIGNHCWMAENLAFLPAVSPADQGSMTDPYYYVYGYQGTSAANAKATANFQNYGALYNWPASLTACPQGWHLPAQSEWIALTDLLGGAPNAGGKLKSIRTSPDDHPRWDSPNTGATNESGFTAFPGGLRRYYGIFEYIGSIGNFWSATEDSQEYSWFRALNNNAVHVGQSITFKSNGFSVRCLRNESQTYLPTVITSDVVNITSNSALCGGNVTDDGGFTVSTCGVVWSTLESPTIEINEGISYDGSGIGEFSSNLSDLIPETDYFVRAYATNSNGTAYGDQISFTTQALPFICGNTFTDNRDGNQYSTVQIGNQCWFAENLAYLPAVSPASDGSLDDPLYYVYGYNGYSTDEAKSTQNYQDYGALYNWTASSTACPDSWHLPTDNDWKILEANVDSQYGIGDPVWDIADWRGFDVGKNLRTTTGWYINTGTDLAGFSARPAGYRFIAGNFTGINESGGWWSSSDNSTTAAWYRYVNAYYDQAYRYWDNTSFGLSVRCLFDGTLSVITSEVLNITSNSALCGGNVTDDGGSSVSARGVVWGTMQNPTIEINEGISFDGNGTGEFLSNLINLTMETQYFVRAYATNEAGTAYGEQKDFYTALLNYSLCEALDNCSLNFATGGDAQFFPQLVTTFDGTDAAQSGNLADEQASWLETIVEGPGTLTFYWKVSSEPDFDYLRLYINGNLVDEMSGEVDWHYKEFGVPEGFISITWYYSKDGSVSSGQDAGWIDQVQYSPSSMQKTK